MALKSAKLINAARRSARRSRRRSTIDEEAFDGIRAWIDKMTDPDYGRVGYISRGSGPARPPDLVDRFPADKSESMTAVGVLARIFLGEDPKKSDADQEGRRPLHASSLADVEPERRLDRHVLLVLRDARDVPGRRRPLEEVGRGDEDRDRRHASARTRDYCVYKGSWDPIDPWGPDGGRVYSTASSRMCLEVYYRYPRVAGTK